MLLAELCPCLARRLAVPPAPLLRRRVAPAATVSRLCSASLGTAGDDADEPRLQSVRGRQPGAAYEEPSRSRRVYVVRFLRRELELSWPRAEREATRCRQLAAAGVPMLTENLLFLTEHGVLRHDLQGDVDILGVPHNDLVRVHGLVGRLRAAEYRLFYPLSRARRDTVAELFRRLPTRRSNLVQELAQTLHLPVLTVSRAVSRMATQITKSSNNKLLRSARLLMELGVPPEELSHSLYVLRLSGPRIRRREQQCRRHGIPLHPAYLGMSDADFQRRLAQGGRLTERTADVEALVAHRLGVSREQVLERTRHSDVLQVLTAARLESVTTLLERAGYGAQDLLSALPSVYKRPAERVRERLETCRQFGRPLPAVPVLVCQQQKFDRLVFSWRREAGLEAEQRGADSGALKVGSGTWVELGSVREVGEGSEREDETANKCENEGEVGDSCESEGEADGFEGKQVVREWFDGEEKVDDCKERRNMSDGLKDEVRVDFADTLELLDDAEVIKKTEVGLKSGVETDVEETEEIKENNETRGEMKCASEKEAQADIALVEVRESTEVNRRIDDSEYSSAEDDFGRGSESDARSTGLEQSRGTPKQGRR